MSENMHYGLEIAGGIFLVLLALLAFFLFMEWANEKWETIKRASHNNEFKDLYDKQKLRSEELEKSLFVQTSENEALKAALAQATPYR